MMRRREKPREQRERADNETMDEEETTEVNRGQVDSDYKGDGKGFRSNTDIVHRS